MNNSFYLTDMIGVPNYYKKAARDKEIQDLSDALYSVLKTPPEFTQPKTKLEPVKVFDRGRIANTGDGQVHYISLGIFDLDTKSAIAEVTKKNEVKVTWTERAGKGEFISLIGFSFVAKGTPVLTYEGGILCIAVPVGLKRDDETLFTGKLPEQK